MKFKPWYGLIIGFVFALILYIAFSKNYLVGNIVFFIFSMIFTFGFYYVFRNLKINTIKPFKIVFYVFSAILFIIAIYGLITGNLIILPDMIGSSGDILSKQSFGSLYFYNNILTTLIESGMLFYLAFKKDK